MFRKRAAPTIGGIKDRHIEHEHWVVLSHAPAKDLPQASAETLFFGFHNFAL
jgi:hypothetical protein